MMTMKMFHLIVFVDPAVTSLKSSGLISVVDPDSMGSLDSYPDLAGQK
jgi:hypothetical protein